MNICSDCLEETHSNHNRNICDKCFKKWYRTNGKCHHCKERCKLLVSGKQILDIKRFEGKYYCKRCVAKIGKGIRFEQDHPGLFTLIPNISITPYYYDGQ